VRLEMSLVSCKIITHCCKSQGCKHADFTAAIGACATTVEQEDLGCSFRVRDGTSDRRKSICIGEFPA
jgi:hypothetical protein